MDHFSWAQLIPSLVGALVGGTLTIIATIVTQSIIGRRERRLRDENALLAAVAALQREADLLVREGYANLKGPRLITLFSCSQLATAWARRSDEKELADALAALEHDLVVLVGSEPKSHEERLRCVAGMSFVCAEWIADPTVFVRKMDPLSIHTVLGSEGL